MEGAAAAEQIAFSEAVGLAMFGAAAVLAIIGSLYAWRRKISFRVLAPLAIVVLAHPGLWMDATGGDCGHTLKVSSIVFTIQALALCAWVVARPRLVEST